MPNDINYKWKKIAYTLCCSKEKFPICLTNKIEKSLIVLDKAKCHETASFDALKDLNENSKYIFIPAGLTGN